MQFIEGQSLDRVLGTLNPSGTVGETGTLTNDGATVEEPGIPLRPLLGRTGRVPYDSWKNRVVVNSAS